MKYSIMQHCFGTVGSGGPIIAFERLLANSHIEYSQIRQTEPARGINLALIRRFVREIKDAKPDLIHIRGLGNEGFHAVVAARLARVPRVLVSIHGTHRDLTQHGSLIRHWIVIYILENLTLLFAHRIAIFYAYFEVSLWGSCRMALKYHIQSIRKVKNCEPLLEFKIVFL
jgi:hypothetical protein